MNNTITLAFNDTEVRSITADDEIWFALVDVCKILELSNPRRVAQRLDDDEKRNFKLRLAGSDPWFVNEPGLYHVILTSKSEKAVPFRRRVTHEVLPSIRKQGFYSLLTKEKLIEVLTDKQREDSTYLDCIDKQAIKRQLLQETREKKVDETRKLWIEHFNDGDTPTFARALKEIWAGDMPMYHKYLDKYNSDLNKKQRGQIVLF
ncbi:MAG: Bro-N domain-containing protein [Candidatus Heteroscillospira sp.]